MWKRNVQQDFRPLVIFTNWIQIWATDQRINLFSILFLEFQVRKNWLPGISDPGKIYKLGKILNKNENI